jgi:hypothetical protein
VIEKSTKASGSLLEYLNGLSEFIIPAPQDLEDRIRPRLQASDVPLEDATKKIVDLILSWYHKYGKKSTLRLISVYLMGKGLNEQGESGDEDAFVSGDRGSTAEHRDVAVGPELGAWNDAGRSEEAVPRGQGLVLLEGGGGDRDGSRDDHPEQGTGRTHPEHDGVSRRLVRLELDEHLQDLEAFRKAYNVIQARVRTVADEGRLLKLVTWSGTTAVVGTLELVIHNIERVVEELKDILRKIDAGEIYNLDEEVK